MIAAVCMNPCFDRTVEVDGIRIGEVNRVRASRMDVGGKGVNVARAASRLGLDTLCLGVMGRENAARFTDMLEEEHIVHRFMEIDGSIRTNMKIVSRNGKPVTEINDVGAPMTEQDVEGFLSLAVSAARESDWCVLTGSIPPGCPTTLYHDLIAALGGERCILDADGETLVRGCEARPFLIKPNLSELEGIMGMPMNDLGDVMEGARRFLDMGVQNVVISMGSEGAVLVVRDAESPMGWLAYFAPAIDVEVKSTVGAGDAMVSGLLYGLEKTGDIREAFRFGVAAGAASVMTEGTQMIRLSDFEELLDQVLVQEVG